MEQPGERRVQSGCKNREQVRSSRSGKVVNRCSERSQTPLDVSRGLMSATMKDTGRERQVRARLLRAPPALRKDSSLSG